MVNKIASIMSVMLIIIGLSGILLSAGCAKEPSLTYKYYEDSDSNAGILVNKGECRTDADCPQEKGCYTTAGVCVTVGKSAVFDVQITPAGSSEFLVTQFSNIQSAGGPLKFVLPQPVELRGNLDASDEYLNGTVVAKATKSLTFLPITFSAKINKVQENKGNFVLRLLPGLTYRIAVIPTDSALPPYIFSRKVSTGGRLSFSIPDVQDMIKIQGRVINSKGEPVENVLVEGKMADNFIKGPVVSTDKDGRFTLPILSAESDKITLLIRPSRGIFFIPIKKTISVSSNEITFKIKDLQRTKKVKLIVVDSTKTRRIPSTTVMAFNSAGIIASGTTDQSGEATLNLPARKVALLLIPPENNPYGVGVFFAQVSELEEDNKFLVPLERRRCINGLVVSDKENNFVAGSQVSFILKDFGLSDIVPTGGLRFSTTTDQDGIFRLCMDPGVYSVVVRPPVTSGLGAFSQPSLVLDNLPQNLKIRLPSGVLVRGLVTDPEKEPIKDANVSFFFHDSQIDIKNITSQPYMVSLAASAVTDNKGKFELVLPVLNKNKYKEDTAFGMPAIDATR